MGEGVTVSEDNSVNNVAEFWRVAQDYWFINFLLNLLGYGVLLLPGFLLIRYLQKLPEVERGEGPLYGVIRLFVLGRRPDVLPTTTTSSNKSTEEEREQDSGRYAVKLMVCVVALQGAYLTWGVLQERVMTRTYGGESFKDSQFLVFINRILALLVAGVYVFSTAQPRHVGPVYKYSLSSISNILSSWCQYEALKYVTFPTQVLAKSSKVIPVMLMGKVVSGRTYPWHEYLTALLLSAGVSLFLLSKEEPGHSHTTETTVAGVIILIGYMGFDSFTSNWQSKLFTQYHMSSFQMMLGVNLFSSALTLVSMIVRGTLFANLSFLFRHSEFLYHAVLLSVCSAVGQLFIYFTIKEFGPLVFTLIMTTRQALSILLSCIVYGHPLDIQAMLGVGLVFVALFLRVYLNQRQKKLKSTSSSLAGSATASPTPQK